MTELPNSALLPLADDSMEEINKKLSILHQMLRSGESLAEALGHPRAVLGIDAAEAQACKEMSIFEKKSYENWKSGAVTSESLPEIDWSTCKNDAPTSAKSLATATRRAQALNRLYDTDQAEPGHSVWFVQNHIVFLPLVKAIARIIGAERSLEEVNGKSNATGLMELQTLNAIIKASASKIQTTSSRSSAAAANSHLLALIEARRELRESLKKNSRTMYGSSSLKRKFESSAKSDTDTE